MQADHANPNLNLVEPKDFLAYTGTWQRLLQKDEFLRDLCTWDKLGGIHHNIWQTTEANFNFAETIAQKRDKDWFESSIKNGFQWMQHGKTSACLRVLLVYVCADGGGCA